MDISSISSRMDITQTMQATSKAEKTMNSLSKDSTDEELMESCESFEAYLVEQVIKSLEATVPKNEEENDYMSYFGDNLYQEYAKGIADSGNLGIAQMLYESMKRE